jgi:hypothetical protein
VKDSDSPKSAGPLAVRTKVAWNMIDCGPTHGYELLKQGELESFRDGKSRKILVSSIHAYIKRRLAAEANEPPPMWTNKATQVRGSKRNNERAARRPKLHIRSIE